MSRGRSGCRRPDRRDARVAEAHARLAVCRQARAGRRRDHGAVGPQDPRRSGADQTIGRDRRPVDDGGVRGDQAGRDHRARHLQPGSPPDAGDGPDAGLVRRTQSDRARPAAARRVCRSRRGPARLHREHQRGRPHPRLCERPRSHRVRAAAGRDFGAARRPAHVGRDEDVGRNGDQTDAAGRNRLRRGSPGAKSRDRCRLQGVLVPDRAPRRHLGPRRGSVHRAAPPALRPQGGDDAAEG